MRTLFNQIALFNRHFILKQTNQNSKTILFDRILTPIIKQSNQIHTTSRQNAIPPLIWLIIAKPITKLAAILTGRYTHFFKMTLFWPFL